MDKVAELMPSTVEKAVSGTPIAVVAQVVNPVRIEAFIAFELTKLASMVNVDQRLSLQAHQVPVIARALMDNFKNENLADISVCLKLGAMGMYGEIFRLDGAVIVGWMQKYLEEKYQVIENQLMSEKENFYAVKKATREEDKPNPERNLLSLLKAVVGDVVPKQENNAQVNEQFKQRIGYVPPSVEEVRQRELHIQYIRENYDAKTSTPLPTWVEESEWLKLKGI